MVNGIPQRKLNSHQKYNRSFIQLPFSLRRFYFINLIVALVTKITQIHCLLSTGFKGVHHHAGNRYFYAFAPCSIWDILRKFSVIGPTTLNSGYSRVLLGLHVLCRLLIPFHRVPRDNEIVQVRSLRPRVL